MTQEEAKKSAWSWRIFSEDFLQLNNSEEPKKSIAVSLFAAFFIVLISAQTLGFINTLYDQSVWQAKYKNSSVVIYSNIA
jgi:hypothetical protein